MFYDTAIASTAISSFNNAALYSPFFLVLGILTLPLFFMVYVYGRDFVARFGWNNQNAKYQINFWISGILLFWLMLFGGNYAVIRDRISLLPVMMAIVLFIFTIVCVNQSVKLNYLSKIQNLKHKWLYFIGLLLVMFVSCMPTWWGFLLQFSAVFCGMIIGCRMQKSVSLIKWLVPTVLFLLVLVLMQPEYFRFGQLGNLTLVHLFAVFITGFFGVTALVTKYTKPVAKIRQSAYIKLKWLSRIFSILAFLLFVLTESVPVFIGLLFCVGLSEMLTIYHSKHVSASISDFSVFVFLFCFGVIIMCPLVSALATVYFLFNEKNIKIKDYTDLL